MEPLTLIQTPPPPIPHPHILQKLKQPIAITPGTGYNLTFKQDYSLLSCNPWVLSHICRQQRSPHVYVCVEGRGGGALKPFKC